MVMEIKNCGSQRIDTHGIYTKPLSSRGQCSMLAIGVKTQSATFKH